MTTKKEEYELLAAAMRDFSAGMEQTRQLVVSTNRRTAQFVKLSMLGLLALGASIFYLLFSVIDDIEKITGHTQALSVNVNRMDDSFFNVSKKLENMDVTMSDMNRSMYILPNMDKTLSMVGRSTFQMSDDIHAMVGDIGAMQTDVSSMSKDIDTMDKRVGGMNSAVHDMTGSMRYMNKEMHDMSRPVDFFPFK